MVKKTITYTDFDGREVTKDFYFNLNKTEFRTLDRKTPGGLERWIDQIRSENDIDSLVDLLDVLILESYGERAEDGRFVKEDPYGRRLSSYFKVSDAWDVMFTELSQDPDMLQSFLTGIVPKEAVEAMNKAVAEEEAKLTPADSNVKPLPTK